LFVMLVGALGIYKRRDIFLLLPVIFLFLQLFIARDFYPSSSGLRMIKEILMDDPVQFTRFMFVFTCGMSFYLFQDKIKYTGLAALGCAACLLAALFIDKLAEPAVCSLGAYALFYLAFKTKIVDINNRYDISYGVYLYAWPIAALIISCYPAITPVYLCCFTFILAFGAGAMSWYLVEKPATKLLRYLPKEITAKPVPSLVS